MTNGKTVSSIIRLQLDASGDKKRVTMSNRDFKITKTLKSKNKITGT